MESSSVAVTSSVFTVLILVIVIIFDVSLGSGEGLFVVGLGDGQEAEELVVRQAGVSAGGLLAAQVARVLVVVRHFGALDTDGTVGWSWPAEVAAAVVVVTVGVDDEQDGCVEVAHEACKMKHGLGTS